MGDALPRLPRARRAASVDGQLGGDIDAALACGPLLVHPKVERDDPLPVAGIQRAAYQRRHGPRRRVEEHRLCESCHPGGCQRHHAQRAVFLKDEGLSVCIQHVGTAKAPRPSYYQPVTP